MTQQRQSVSVAHARVSYPVFTHEESPATVKEMNLFYEALCAAVLAYAERLNQSREGGARMLTAEYRVQTDETRITVEYTICIRRRGRTEARKKLTHTWEGGALVLPVRRPRSLRKKEKVTARCARP